MKTIINKISLLCTLLVMNTQLNAQSTSKYKEGLKIYLNSDSSSYVKATGLAQIWLRYNSNNPGSTVFGTRQKNTFDVGLRRVRYQVMAQLNPKVFVYTQIGINSFNYISARKTPIFFHDATTEYNVYKNYFTLGAGLSAWNGTSRYSSSSVGTIMALDLPVIQETTNDVTDQFVRKLGVYAKGKVSGFDYRFSASNPFPVQTALSPVATLPATQVNTAYYSTKAPKLQYQGYAMWQFLDKESNLLPYMIGSYLGKKRVLNIGAGFLNQKEAMWYRNTTSDTIKVSQTQIGVDVFYDAPLNKEKQTAITAYASYLNYNFGPNYLRNAGAMNTANGVGTGASFNGTGNAFPLIGTGNVLYTQAAYLCKKDLLKSQGTLQPYLAGSYANYEKLADPVLVYNIGINWLQSGNNSKISLDYQSRPVFNTNTNGDIVETKSARRGMIVMQYQISF
ncbi:MAG: hypothetical protein V4667_09620 [Bacteroidota bacterium]